MNVKWYVYLSNLKNNIEEMIAVFVFRSMVQISSPDEE